MSLTLTLSGNSSILTAEYFPPIEINKNYICGLIDFQTYNSVPNVDERNNLFYIDDEMIKIPTGSYEIDNIAEYINECLKKRSKSPILLRANNNTLKCEIKSNQKIFFDKPNSIGSLLGFSKQELVPNILHESDLPVNIIKVNVIRVECNIVTGSFMNNIPVHTLHEFSLNVSPGYKIIEVPSNVIYLPVNVGKISSLTLRLVDQDGDLINFRKETITIRLHLKPQNVDIQQ